MTNLSDFLKVKQVRCVKAYDGCLKVGEEYNVVDVSVEIKVKDDEGEYLYWESDHFEPVLEPAENPLQDVELTPEFETEASEFKFEVGNKVYKYGETDVKTVLEVFEDGYMRISNYPHRVNHEVLCHATPENHAVLSRPFPAIEFEQPPTQADIDNAAVDKLAQAMKDKLAEKREQDYHGWATCKHGDLVQLLINHVDKGDPIDVANFCAFLFARGEPLTEAVLDE